MADAAGSERCLVCPAHSGVPGIVPCNASS
jgi:hypothetical protein